MRTVCRLLLVEDDVMVAEVVRDVLEPEGYALIYAATLDAARDALWLDRFDLVLCDGLSANRVTAWENAGAVLALAGSTPVALFSAHPVDESVARTAGFCGVIQKPFDLDPFLQQVQRLLTDAGLLGTANEPFSQHLA
jgi:DNA-binding response OmpR family regulator